MYRRWYSRAFRTAFALVVVGLIVFNRSKKRQNALLLSAFDVFVESRSNRLLLRAVMPQFLSFRNQR